MKKREDRRDRTIRYGERARKVHLRWVHPSGAVDCACEFSAWKFAKGKSVGCGCRRRYPNYSPKIAIGLCHGAGYGFHPCVRERIEGKRLVKAWLHELRSADPLDIDL